MKRMVKKNYKIIIGVILGLLISSIGVYAVSSLSSSEISYDNDSSGLEAKTMQQAIDKLYERTKTYKEYIPNDNPNRKIEKAYKYDENSESKTYCVTGDEGTCFATTCYDNKSKNACEAGTIIVYKVNDNKEPIRFHVLHDDGETMTLQSQENTVHDVLWYAESNDNTYGPTTALDALEQVTQDWTNVNKLNYTIGNKDSDLGYSGCDSLLNCSSTIYDLTKNSVRSRMITLQEAKSIGCLQMNELNQGSCPDFMHNYLKDSKQYGGSFEGSSNSKGYWTMTAHVADVILAWEVDYRGYLAGLSTTFPDWHAGARAVVEINKNSE